MRGAAGGRAGAGPQLPLPRLPDGGYRLAEMKKFLRRLLPLLTLTAALLFSQHAAMLHGLAHAEHELALATQPGGKVPALNHGSEVCAAYGALAQALGNAVVAQAGERSRADAQSASFRVVPVATRIVFDSRAPPLSA